jgi:hypothetical protein
MRKRTAILIALGAVAAPVAVGVALATPPSGLTSELLARGAAGEFRIHDKDLRLRMDAKRPTDVAIVRATLEEGGFTGWHGHPSWSLVIVKSGTLTMYEPAGDHRAGHHQHGNHRPRCHVQSFGPGDAFVHPPSVHNFVNTGEDPVEFYVEYFVPAGATPLLRDEPAPRACSTGDTTEVTDDQLEDGSDSDGPAR